MTLPSLLSLAATILILKKIKMEKGKKKDSNEDPKTTSNEKQFEENRHVPHYQPFVSKKRQKQNKMKGGKNVASVLRIILPGMHSETTFLLISFTSVATTPRPICHVSTVIWRQSITRHGFHGDRHGATQWKKGAVRVQCWVEYLY